jgi:NADPH-dependent 2,4-dienoyl-CoA reductase/sulfur reductase-like enzyme/rhodanese-related sulfurtransferase
MARFLIVGGVAGGMSAAARLRRLSEKDEIIVFERGSAVSFANCGLPYYIGGEISERESLFLQTPATFKTRFNVDVRTGHNVLSIDRKTGTIKVKELSSGREYAEKYDKLLLSPGAQPMKPALPGIELPGIFTLRSIDDTDKIKNYIIRTKPISAAVVGAGFIGLEMAENLHKLGLKVTLVEATQQVLNVFDADMAGAVKEVLYTKGVDIELGSKVISFEKHKTGMLIKLDSGKFIEAEMVLLSIGVSPESRLAENAGLTLGVKKSIAVDEYMQTSDPDIYAVGDAVESTNPVTGKKQVMPLAGPANKQGRIAAYNMLNGNRLKYKGTIGTAVAKIFDMAAACTGANEKQLREVSINYAISLIHPNSHAGYYPGATMLTLKLLFAPETGRILGAQCAGYESVEKVIDVISAYISMKATIYDLEEFEQAYAPPYSSSKDPVNMAGFVADNIIAGNINTMTWDAFLKEDKNSFFILDVRSPSEFRTGSVEGAVNIHVDTLRQSLDRVPKDKKIAVFCRVGLRAYVACRILAQNGYKEVYNISGGIITYDFLGF